MSNKGWSARYVGGASTPICKWATNSIGGGRDVGLFALCP